MGGPGKRRRAGAGGGTVRGRIKQLTGKVVHIPVSEWEYPADFYFAARVTGPDKARRNTHVLVRFNGARDRYVFFDAICMRAQRRAAPSIDLWKGQGAARQMACQPGRALEAWGPSMSNLGI